MKNPVFKSKVRPMKISVAASEALKEIKDTPFWAAIQEYMAEYARFQRDRAFFLDETQEGFTTKHTRYTARCEGQSDMKNFVEKTVRRESDA